MIKELRAILRPICPCTTEHLHRVLVLQKYSSKVGMIVVHHLYHYMNRMHKIDRVHLQETNSSQEVLNHQGWLNLFTNIFYFLFPLLKQARSFNIKILLKSCELFLYRILTFAINVHKHICQRNQPCCK